MKPIVSVIIPCYRQAHFLPEAISSLQAQTYPHWEAIVIDDGSPDNTAQVTAQLARRDPRIRLVCKENGGLSSARNAGLAVARGEFIQFLDADDLLARKKFEHAIEFFEAHREAKLVYTTALYFSDPTISDISYGPYGDTPDDDWTRSLASDTRPLLEKLVERNLFPVCAPITRRSLIERIGLFNESLAALEDWDYWFRAALLGAEFQYVERNDDMALVRWHPTSMTHDTARMTLAGFHFRVLRHRQLPIGRVREQNFIKLLSVANHLPASDRFKTYSTIVAACASLREKCQSVFCLLFDVGGPLSTIAAGCSRVLPWRVRERLADWGLRSVIQ